MVRPLWTWTLPLAPVFVFLSSYLGLAGRFAWRIGDGLGFMAGIWRESVVADVVFVAGTLLSLALTLVIVARRGTLLAIAVGFLAHWLTYWASFLLLPASSDEFVSGSRLEAVTFVLQWGIVGLLFAALVPPLLARRWLQGEAAPADDGVTDPGPARV